MPGCGYATDSCKTLVYALQVLTNYRLDHFPSVLINVTYNQTINGLYNVGAPYIGILHITGNEGVYINFPYPASSLQIVHRYKWEWIHIRFASQSFGIGCQNPAVAHYGDRTSLQNTVGVSSCTLTSVAWLVVNVTNFVINGTEFGGISDRYCPTVCANYNSGNSQTQCTIKISKNYVNKCDLGWLSTSIFTIYNGLKDFVVEIVNNTFSNLTNDKTSSDQSAIQIVGNLESLTFSDNLFINNRLGCIYMSGNVDDMLVQTNTFHTNQQRIFDRRIIRDEPQTVLIDLHYQGRN